MRPAAYEGSTESGPPCRAPAALLQGNGMMPFMVLEQSVGPIAFVTAQAAWLGVLLTDQGHAASGL